jgi:Lipid A core - O-antigen ligase and related enzymes
MADSDRVGGAVLRRQCVNPLGQRALPPGAWAVGGERFKDAGQIAPRLALWKYGWTMFKAHPLLGVGWGEFPSYQFEYAKSLGGVEIANNSHDIFIDLLAKTGLMASRSCCSA